MLWEPLVVAMSRMEDKTEAIQRVRVRHLRVEPVEMQLLILAAGVALVILQVALAALALSLSKYLTT